MLSERTLEILSRTLADVLEEAAFSFSEPLEPGADWEGSVLVAEIDYVGPESGQLTLALPQEYARELADNLLGVESSGSEQLPRARDCVGELLNIVAGVVLSELWDSRTPTELGIPRVFEETLEICAERMKTCAVLVALCVDGEYRVELGATPAAEMA